MFVIIAGLSLLATISTPGAAANSFKSTTTNASKPLKIYDPNWPPDKDLVITEVRGKIRNPASIPSGFVPYKGPPKIRDFPSEVPPGDNEANTSAVPSIEAESGDLITIQATQSCSRFPGSDGYYSFSDLQYYPCNRKAQPEVQTVYAPYSTYPQIGPTQQVSSPCAFPAGCKIVTRAEATLEAKFTTSFGIKKEVIEWRTGLDLSARLTYGLSIEGTVPANGTGGITPRAEVINKDFSTKQEEYECRLEYATTNFNGLRYREVCSLWGTWYGSGKASQPLWVYDWYTWCNLNGTTCNLQTRTY